MKYGCPLIGPAKPICMVSQGPLGGCHEWIVSFLHDFTISSISLSIFLQIEWFLVKTFIFTIPRWPMWSSWSTALRRVLCIINFSNPQIYVHLAVIIHYRRSQILQFFDHSSALQYWSQAIALNCFFDYGVAVNLRGVQLCNLKYAAS